MRRIAIASVCAAVMLAGLAETANAKIVVIDRESARGDDTTAQVSGSIDHPKRIWVKVRSRPRQDADGRWEMLCQEGTHSRSTDGQYSAMTPFRRRLRMGYRRPDKCGVVASAHRSGSGRIVIVLLARI